jgi:hypothetical protein
MGQRRVGSRKSIEEKIISLQGFNLNKKYMASGVNRLINSKAGGNNFKAYAAGVKNGNEVAAKMVGKKKGKKK